MRKHILLLLVARGEKEKDVRTTSDYRVWVLVTCAETDGEGDIDDDEAIDWSNSDEENENIDDNDEN
ncbi:hypothetical protein EVAR_91835_1 [Eumeta japonica]|uniref:Uncharacterized protein n=1 Tax=Eumeta variegata TaxID=151549 RepID=A0A4C2A4N1_EUMVA|nr:hypothetical protein EVAR_91835_1 [Eumeta japonica]